MEEEKQEKPVEEGKEEVEEVTEVTPEEPVEEPKEEVTPEEPVEEPKEEVTPEAETSEEEKPKEEDIDFHTPEEDKPKRTEKEKAEFALKSVASRVEELGGDPSKLIGTPKEDTSQFVTKRDFAKTEAKKVARSPKEFDAIMAWVDKGLTVEEGHLLANKGRIKSTFAEIERGNVALKEATGAGEKKPVVDSPAPTETQLMQWRTAKMVYDSVTKIAKGKHTEEYYDGKAWVSRKIK